MYSDTDDNFLSCSSSVSSDRSFASAFDNDDSIYAINLFIPFRLLLNVSTSFISMLKVFTYICLSCYLPLTQTMFTLCLSLRLFLSLHSHHRNMHSPGTNFFEMTGQVADMVVLQSTAELIWSIQSLISHQANILNLLSTSL